MGVTIKTSAIPKMGNPESVVQTIAHATDMAVSEMQRRHSIGKLRGMRTFYRVTNPDAVAFLTTAINRAVKLI